MTPQEIHAAVVSLLQQQGLPLTTANLNRGMMALSQNDMSTEGAALPAVNASIDRTMDAAQQAASRPATAQQPLPTPPIPPTATTQQPPQQVAPTTLELNSPGSLPAGVRNSVEAFLADKGTQATMPDGSATSAVAAPVAAPTAAMPQQREFSLATIGEDIRNGRVPNPNPDLPLILFGTGPVGLAGRAYPAMQQFMRQRTMDIMRQNPPRPPSNMLNQAGEGFDEALAARTQAGQRSTYRGEGVDDFIQGGNAQTSATSAPSSSVKTNTPTWKGESDPSAPMGARSTAVPQTTQSNTATPRSGGSTDTSGASAAIKQSLTKQKQMAASKSTRKSEK